ncbi:hypothetical protein GHT06_020120 [Daphnia sinensis]|uniref:RBR-type E3 ubiquitin transferase n=1 Tax=Daphnia sinensis TaxID=1820382 RepID=A0AAD5L336_9CRUS|nr:hypothetical protein GHT06_020120 [Daphnia sinensis]
MEDHEAQNDEILALKSILDETQIQINNSSHLTVGCIYVKPEVPTTFEVQAKKDGQLHTFRVQHLSPIELHFNYPVNYPSEKPPNFTLVCKWLRRDQLSKLCQKLDQKWEDDVKGQAVLFEWIQILQYEALEWLEICSYLDLSWVYMTGQNSRLSCGPSDYQQLPTAIPGSRSVVRLDPRAVCDNQYEGDLLDVLREYERIAEQLVFDKASHTCKVCFDHRLGANCIQFPNCGHVYCKECMSSYFEVKITEGTVNGLICPEDKCTSQPSPGQIKELISPDAFERYDSLLLQSTIASMINIAYCPRQQCQYPVSYDPESNLVSCPYCNFHFCLMCKATYHGVAPCKMSSTEKMKLFETYTNGDDSTKVDMEKRYGKKQLISMINDIQAETWIGQNSKPCPHCNAPIEKKDGCNKMSCPRCSSYFCWLCLTQLDPKCPYLHFSNASARCNLFEGLVQDDAVEVDWININGDTDDDFSEDEDFINIL